MAEYIIQEETLTEIADAIRTKTKTTGEIATTSMADEILGISGGSGASSKEELGIYVQDNEPTNAVDGDIWIDTDDQSIVVAADVIMATDAANDGNVEIQGFLGGGSDLSIDNTLTIEGYAADAKATGDAIYGHTEDKNNPHGVTAEQVGAAPASLVDHVDVVAINNNKLRKDSYISDVLNVDLNNPDGTANRSGYFDGSSVNYPPNAVFGVRDVYWVNSGFVIVEARCFMTDSTTKIWRCTYNANVSSGWLGWNEVYDSGHKPTAAEIGAAPAGFGLGTTVPHAPNDDINQLDISKTGYFTGLQNSPYPDAWYVGYNIAYGNGYAYQVAWVLNSLGIMAQRFIDAGTIGEWEYHNPPMALGTEYRTTERWKGKPVYVKAVDMGALVSNSLKRVSLDISDASEYLDYYVLAVSGNFATVVITYTNTATSAFIEDMTKICFTTATDMSGYTGTAIVKYVK